ncbi:MAG: tetratricopeptide repeat protein [Crocinitomicaceae bacterium]|nr:tetratricopeptide repeat protein [Crocinitomicaceae bacterium]
MKFLKYCFLLLFFFSGLNIFSQERDTTLNIIEKGKIKYRLEDGKNKLYTYDYRGALQAFREVLQAEPSNVLAKFRIAQCYYELKRFDLSKKYIDQVTDGGLKKKMRKEFIFLKGKIYHRNEQLPEAISYLEQYKGKAKKKEVLDSEVDRFIRQCNYAEEAIKRERAIEIINFGDHVNTVNPEYSPSITADGKTMIFTSRRPDTKGGGVDLDFDHKYYEDIYVTTWDDEDEEWSASKGIPGSLNTEFHDACLNISADGKYIYIYRNILNVTRTGDIYVSKKSKSGKWGTPKPVADNNKEINSTYFESSASLTAEGNEMYFVSDRPGGNGLADIYYIKKTGSTWGEAVNLGSEINSKYDEKFVYVHPQGNLLFFSSDGVNSMGGYDIFYCKKNGEGKWGIPQNMGSPINTVLDEKTFTITADGKTGYIGAYYEGSKGESDIFKIDCSSLKLIE